MIPARLRVAVVSLLVVALFGLTCPGQAHRAISSTEQTSQSGHIRKELPLVTSIATASSTLPSPTPLLKR